MAWAQPMISGAPSRMTVRARRQLTSPEKSEAFLADLAAKLEQDSETLLSFDDFDVSQNPLSLEAFTELFGLFVNKAVRVQRIRLFGCATFDDNAADQLAGWLSCVTTENMPHEIHLSDCAITTDGFLAIAHAIAGNDAFPQVNPRSNAVCPMYMRVENNYIDPTVMQEQISEGVFTTFTKNSGNTLPNPNAKVKLLLNSSGQFQQRQGVPPAPEHAPPPREVHDKNSAPQMGGSGGMHSNNARGPSMPWAAGMHPAQGAAMQQFQNFAQNFAAMAGGAVHHQQGGWGQVAWSPAQQQQQEQQQQQQQQQHQQQQHQQQQQHLRVPGYKQNPQEGSAAQRGGAADRSRTPVASKPAFSLQKPVAKARANIAKPKLPSPWEEHHSDEFGIPYFWNASNGESSWERPT